MRRAPGWPARVALLAVAAGAAILAGVGPSRVEPDAGGCYAVHHTGLMCGVPPCFSYCAHNLQTGEDRRFSHLVLPPGQEQPVGAQPLIVDGMFRPVGGPPRRGLKLRVSHVTGPEPGLAPRDRCRL